MTHLPPVAQRYLKHAIAPDTRLAVRAVIDMHGEIRPGPDDAWMDFRAREVLAPRRGFVWRVQAQRGPVRLSGTDDYVGDSARMRLGLFGFLPVIRGSGGPGSDFARSARGRLVSESCWVPSAFVDDGLHWEAVDDQHVNVAMTVDGEATTLCLSVAQDGALRRTVISRRGDVTDDGAWADIPFAGTVDEERTFGGYTIPSRLRASWWHDTEREFEFFRATVDAADFA